MTWHLYLDESGDLGFDFEAKFPSRCLTISILAISEPGTVKAIDSAMRKTLRRKVNRRKKCEQELKGASSTIEVKRYFYEQIRELQFEIYAITVEKRRIVDHLRPAPQTKSRFYNFIARNVLDQIPFEKAPGAVELIVDKSKSRREIQNFNGYVLAQLEGRIDPRFRVSIYHRQSASDRVLSAADLFCWGVFRRRERRDEEWYNVFREKVLYDGEFLADRA